MSLTLRPATAADVPALEIVRRQAIEATYAGALDRRAYADDVAMPDVELPRWIADATVAVLLLETPVTPAAYGAADRSCGKLLAIYTAPDYERRGYATQLVTALRDMVAAHDVDRMRADVPLPVEPFFHTIGFERTGPPHAAPIPTVPMSISLEESS